VAAGTARADEEPLPRLLLGRQGRGAGDHRVDSCLVRELRTLVGGDRERDARRRHVRGAERLGEELRVAASADPALERRGDERGERERLHRGDARGGVGPGAALVRHLHARDRRRGALVLERAAGEEHGVTRDRVQERGARAAIPEQVRSVRGVDERRRVPGRHLHAEAEHGRLGVRTARIREHHARRAGDVVRGAERAVGPRSRGAGKAAHRARVGAARLGAMAGAASHRARRGELLVPEQRLPQVHLGGRERVARRHGRRRQRLERRRRRRQLRQRHDRRQQEHEPEAASAKAGGHRGVLPRVRLAASARAPLGAS